MAKTFMNVLLATGLLACALAHAETPDTAADLERFLADADTLTAEFHQILADAEGEPGAASSGRIYVSRPGRFRWEYQQPIEQLVLSDGERLWMYDQDLEQVTVRSVDESLDGTPAMLLSGKGRLEDSFSFGTSYSEDGVDWIELVPLAERPDFQGLRVGLAQGVIRVMELKDNLDQITRIEFRDVELHSELNPELFQFEPPAGVDVIGQEGF